MPVNQVNQGRPARFRQLDLTAEQKAKLEELWQDMPQGPERREAFRSILTDEQRAKLESLHTHRVTRYQNLVSGFGSHNRAGFGRNGRGPLSVEERVQRMQERLNLTDEQASNLKEILEEKPRGSERREAIRSILTDEQRKLWDSHRAKRRKFFPGFKGSGPRNIEYRINFLTEHLDLSDEQVSQLKDIFENNTWGPETRNAIVAILTEEQKAEWEALIADGRTDQE